MSTTGAAVTTVMTQQAAHVIGIHGMEVAAIATADHVDRILEEEELNIISTVGAAVSKSVVSSIVVDQSETFQGCAGSGLTASKDAVSSTLQGGRGAVPPCHLFVEMVAVMMGSHRLHAQ